MRVIKRHLEPVLRELLKDESVIVLDGPRTAGKSFVVRQVVESTGAKFLDLDEPADLAAVQSDPSGALRHNGLVVVDEFQRATSEVLGAIKAKLNKEGVTPGLFLLTGSTRADLLPQLSDYLTGRHHRTTLLPLSQAEMEDNVPKLLRTLLQGPSGLADLPSSDATAESYFNRVVVGGLPLAIARTSTQSRRRWFGDYVDDVIRRAADAENLKRSVETDGQEEKAPPARVLREVFRGVSATTAQLLNATRIQRICATELGDAPSERTVRDWLKILEEVHLIYRLEAWGTTLRSRVNRHPKVHVVDSGIVAYMMGLTTDNLTLPTKLTESGHLLESFVVMELLKEIPLLGFSVDLGHFRTSDDQEVDLIVETEEGDVFGVEVKRASRIDSSDLAGFRLLANRLGPRFKAGLVLHAGNHTLETSVNGVFSTPISNLWMP